MKLHKLPTILQNTFDNLVGLQPAGELLWAMFSVSFEIFWDTDSQGRR